MGGGGGGLEEVVVVVVVTVVMVDARRPWRSEVSWKLERLIYEQ